MKGRRDRWKFTIDPGPATGPIKARHSGSSVMAETRFVDVRGTLLAVINEQQPKRATDGSLQTGSVLRETGQRIGAAFNLDLEQALLTQLHDLFRTGYLAWGFNLSNPSPPFFHITERGRKFLAILSRDPSNPDGYLRALEKEVTLNPIADSYIRESLACFTNDLPKAAAVMVGGASENIALELRDAITGKLQLLNRTISQGY
jgi:hypothetical protein